MWICFVCVIVPRFSFFLGLGICALFMDLLYFTCSYHTVLRVLLRLNTIIFRWLFTHTLADGLYFCFFELINMNSIIWFGATPDQLGRLFSVNYVYKIFLMFIFTYICFCFLIFYIIRMILWVMSVCSWWHRDFIWSWWPNYQHWSDWWRVVARVCT